MDTSTSLKVENLRVGQLFTVNDDDFAWSGNIFRLVSRAGNLLFVDCFDRDKQTWKAWWTNINLRYKGRAEDYKMIRLSKNVLNPA